MSTYKTMTLPSNGDFWVVIPKFADGTYYVGFELFATKEMAELRASSMAPDCDPIVAHFNLMDRSLTEYSR